MKSAAHFLAWHITERSNERGRECRHDARPVAVSYSIRFDLSKLTNSKQITARPLQTEKTFYVIAIGAENYRLVHGVLI